MAASIRVIRDDLPEHGATLAWQNVRPGGGVPERIVVLKGDNSSAVYRLEGVGREGAAVIAKRCHPRTARVERYVYEELLPRLPVNGVRFYGALEEGDEELTWLFVEDLGSENFSAEHAPHRILAGKWVGLVHASAATDEVARRLPDRGPAHYLEHLGIARRNILDAMGNRVLGDGDRAAMRELVTRLDVVESDWSRIESLCAAMPRTLIHGDLARRNVRVVPNGGDPGLAVFDWEMAGWGIPGVDLRSVERETYRAAVQDRWPATDRATVNHWAEVGSLLRESIASISWRSWFLAYQWARRELVPIVRYGEKLEATFESLNAG